MYDRSSSPSRTSGCSENYWQRAFSFHVHAVEVGVVSQDSVEENRHVLGRECRYFQAAVEMHSGETMDTGQWVAYALQTSVDGLSQLT